MHFGPKFLRNMKTLLERMRRRLNLGFGQIFIFRVCLLLCLCMHIFHIEKVPLLLMSNDWKYLENKFQNVLSLNNYHQKMFSFNWTQRREKVRLLIRSREHMWDVDKDLITIRCFNYMLIMIFETHSQCNDTHQYISCCCCFHHYQPYACMVDSFSLSLSLSVWGRDEKLSSYSWGKNNKHQDRK